MPQLIALKNIFSLHSCSSLLSGIVAYFANRIVLSKSVIFKSYAKICFKIDLLWFHKFIFILIGAAADDEVEKNWKCCHCFNEMKWIFWRYKVQIRYEMLIGVKNMNHLILKVEMVLRFHIGAKKKGGLTCFTLVLQYHFAQYNILN
jgi:hypothetical protein